MKLRSSFIALLAVASLTGCGKKDGATATTDGGAPSVASSGAPSVVSSGASSAAPGPKGLGAPGNDAAIVLLATNALACKWERYGFATSCPAYKIWSAASESFNDGDGDATLISMLEDPDEKVRYLAALKLDFRGLKYRTDKDLATRLVAVAEGEKSVTFAGSLGSALGEIDVEKTGLFDRIKAIVQKHELASLRASTLLWLLEYNRGSDSVYSLTQEGLNGSEKEIRSAALSGLANGGDRKQTETCKLFVDNMENADDDLAARATADVLAWGGGYCRASFDAALDEVDKKLKTSKAPSANDYMTGLRDLCAGDKSTPPQKQKAMGLATGMATTKGAKAPARNAALDAVQRCDPAAAKAFIGKFADDPDAEVKSHVKELLRPKV